MNTNKDFIAALPTVDVMQQHAHLQSAMRGRIQPASMHLLSVSGRLLCIMLAVLFIAIVGSDACAQSTFGSMRGTVQDTSGAVIPNAAVTIHSLDEGVERQTVTDDTGAFVAENLKPGHYRLTIHHDGFADTIVNSATLEARQELRIPVTLAIAEQATEVEVTGASDAINTENATLSDSKDNQLITQLATEQSCHHNQSSRLSRHLAERATRQHRQYRSWRRQCGTW